jgi:phenylacetate-CoA ligase
MYSSLYAHSPLLIQEALLSTRAQLRKILREDRSFEAYATEIQSQYYWSGEKLEKWQSESIASLLEKACRTVPHYRRIAQDRRGGLRELHSFPILTKGMITHAPKDFLSEKASTLFRFSGSTSGTTGSPLKLYQDLSAIRRENAFIWRQLHWAGYRRGERRVWLRGDMIVPAAQQKGPFWRRNAADNMLMMSSYHLSEDHAKGYLDALQAYDPVLIQAYPSAIGFLANWLWSKGRVATLPSLRGIVTSSETLTLEQRQRIEVAFGVRVFDWYGSCERVAAIGTCSLGNYHVMEDYGFTEFVQTEDGGAEIIGTGFNNDLMPLIRYSTGDSVELADENAECGCKSHFRMVKKIFGRTDDSVTTPDGRSIGRLDHIYKGLAGIAEAQIVQTKIDAIEIRVVPQCDEETYRIIRESLVKNLRERVGGEMKIEVNFVSALERTKNGKLRAVVSTV